MSAPYYQDETTGDPSMSGIGLFALRGFIDRQGVMWEEGVSSDAAPLLSKHHYLGPIKTGDAEMVVVGSQDGVVVAAQVWRRPTARNLPADGTWLELSRWCLTPHAGPDAGSRNHRWATRLIRERFPQVTTLVSYSDPSHGHTGALYRACNWTWAPTWHRLRTPPTGNGSWDGVVAQSVKDRWVFPVQPDPRRDQVVHIDDDAAVRHWADGATEQEKRWARGNAQLEAAL